MDQPELFAVHCETEVYREAFVQYVRATSPESAVVLANGKGFVALSASKVEGGSDWNLDAANEMALRVAEVRAAVTSIQQAEVIRNPFWTVFWATLLAIFVGTAISMFVGSIMRR